MIAEPIDCTTLATSNGLRDGARKLPMAPALNSAHPATSIRFRPNASESPPTGSSAALIVSVAASTTHDASGSGRSRSAARLGSATPTALMSTTLMNCAAAIPAKAVHLRE